MVPLPAFLKDFQNQANEFIRKGFVKEIEFAGATYQVLVEDPTNQKQCWVFLQLEGKGNIRDGFCSGEEVEEWEHVHSCIHMAVAYKSIYGAYSLPLHQRFARSLWNQLCLVYLDRLGDNPTVLTTIQPGYYLSETASHDVIFSVKAKKPKAIKNLEYLIHKRPRETEETSIKFSNLPEEEITLWKQGQPSTHLRYELSFWSDIAKWLLRLQEENRPYEISFKFSNKELPNWIQIDFEDVEIGFYIAESTLPSIINALTTVKSPLMVRHANNQGIGCITYDKVKGILHIESEEQQGQRKRKKETSKSIKLPGWDYIPGDGFYANEPHILLQSPNLKGEELSNILTEYGALISTFLLDYQIHIIPSQVRYSLSFDSDWNLHIKTYLFEKDDLSTGFSRLIDDWAFLEDDGFYLLEDKHFDQLETVIPIQKVSEFVSQSRSWLNGQDGFKTYLKAIEYQLLFNLSSANRLTFSRTLASSKQKNKIQDFGSWVYVEGSGFYPKTSSAIGSSIRPGTSLSQDQIPLFIKMNKDELEVIPGFFSKVSPLIRALLKVELTDKNTILIQPEYEFLEGYEKKSLRNFDEFIYVEGEGFSEIPSNLRLPEKFRRSQELEGEDRDLFLTYEIDEIQNLLVPLSQKLIRPKKMSLVTSQVMPVKEKGKGWYRFALYYKTDQGLIPVTDLFEQIHKKETFLFSELGLIDLREKKYDWIRQLKKNKVDIKDKAVFLNALEFMRLNAFDPLQFLDLSLADSKKSLEYFEELLEFRTPEVPDIEGFKSHLRPYQEIGVHWLWFLYHQQLSGLLCDDMGLGKTHQAMGLLASIHNLYKKFAEGTKQHYLIVCPTSVIYHWQEKLAQFLPGLRVYTYYGAARNLQDFLSHYDILLTSYGILRNELEVISQIEFEVAIYDEIQIAKNQASRIYSALTKINSQMKLGLTGTPIENYIKELKSLFDIVLPSYMPGEKDYRELFIRPIEKEHNSHRKDLLYRLVKPFVLRRKKEEVLTDLPDKIEEIAHCDLSTYQRQLYNDILQERRKHLLSNLKDESNPIPYLHIFALLSSLKQICNHPAVYLKETHDYLKYESGKWDLFLELVEEARESRQKVVVFSQYLGMLDIIESHLSEHEIGFASLRGATQNRKEQIRKFNTDPDCEIFVGSLQAAGLGVDLTAGSVVIHYDRWWNAARENQATDRVHRIGQTKGVQVFKFVTKNTFEEKIDAMIRRKGQLMEDVIGVDDQLLLKKFTRDDLIDLLNITPLETEKE